MHLGKFLLQGYNHHVLVRNKVSIMSQENWKKPEVIIGIISLIIMTIGLFTTSNNTSASKSSRINSENNIKSSIKIKQSSNNYSNGNNLSSINNVQIINNSNTNRNGNNSIVVIPSDQVLNNQSLVKGNNIKLQQKLAEKQAKPTLNKVKLEEEIEQALIKNTQNLLFPKTNTKEISAETKKIKNEASEKYPTGWYGFAYPSIFESNLNYLGIKYTRLNTNANITFDELCKTINKKCTGTISTLLPTMGIKNKCHKKRTSKMLCFCE